MQPFLSTLSTTVHVLTYLLHLSWVLYELSSVASEHVASLHPPLAQIHFFPDLVLLHWFSSYYPQVSYLVIQLVGLTPLATVHVNDISVAASQLSWLVNLICSHTRSTQELSGFKKHDLPEAVFWEQLYSL